MPSVRKREAGASESEEVVYPIDLLNRDNPRSVINLVTPKVQAAIFKATQTRGDLFRLSERSLRQKVKPTVTDSQLRLAFWNEYHLAQAHAMPMRMASVYSGICTQQFFDGFYLAEDANVAWMLCPPTSYIIALEEILNRSQERLSDVLDVPVVDENGNVDVKLAELVLKIHLATEQRIKGAVVVRTESRNLHLNASVPVTPEQANAAVNKIISQGSLDEIEQKIARLRKEEAAAARKLAGKPTEG